MLITGAYCVLNKGDAALRLGGLPSIRKEVPDAQFTILTLFPEHDAKVYHDGEIIQAINTPFSAINAAFRCLTWRFLHEYLKMNSSFVWNLVDVDVIRNYIDCDVVVDISGDSISEVTGTRGTLYHLFHLWIAECLNKPTIVYAQSVGPFSYTKFFAKRMLNKVDLITVRGKVSYDYLKQIGIDKPPMYLTADIAFLMQPASEERIDEIFTENNIENKPFVGMSVSNLISTYYGSYEGYVELMAKVVDYIVDELHTSVVFIPHVTGPEKEKDDRVVAEDIFKLVRNKSDVKLIHDDYPPQEMWGIIKRAEMFVGARMHACIGALSVGVPVINISYHHKSAEIMAMFGLSDNVIAGKEVNYSNLTQRINETWKHRDEIRSEMAPKVIEVKKTAHKNAEIFRALLENGLIK